MIELRWLERPCEQLRDEHGQVYANRIERVLQYRQSENFVSGMTGKEAWRMSAWTDVPAVRDN